LSCDRNRCRHADRAFRCARTRDRHGGMARDADQHAVPLEFNLGQAGFIEQFRQIADRVVIDRGRFRHRRTPGLARHDQTALPAAAPISAAAPLIASA
jgi:hypothetical protein